MKKILTILTVVLILINCSKNNEDISFDQKKEVELWEKAATYLTALNVEDWLDKQKLEPQKVALGQKLFLDKRLSVNQTQSCNTCHNLNTFGVDNKVTSVGHDGILEKRNTPSVFNAVLHFAQFWDGRAENLEKQASVPILNPEEMGMPSEVELVQRLQKDSNYVRQFDAVYDTQNGSITFENIIDAIATFEKTLLTSSRVDDYLLGDYNALNDLEKEGMNTFIDLGCIPCHSGKALGGEMMHRFALQGYYWDKTKSQTIDDGRFSITEKEEDKYVFKVPSLRNVAQTFPYFHDGSVANLDEAVEIMANVQLNYNINKDETKAIVAFLNALTGVK